MKKIKLLIALSLTLMMSGNSFSQTLHKAKVLGVITISSQDFATIIDLTKNDIYKTSVYKKGLLKINEEIELNITSNSVKIVKAEINETIYAFKEIQTNLETNPFEIIGINHNILLDAIGYSPDFSSLNDENIFNIIQSESNNSSDQSFSEIKTNLNYILTNDFMKFDETLSQILKNGSTLNDRDKKVIIKLFTEIKESENYKEVINKIMVIESSISSDKELSATGRKTLFIATSVARHSSTYWEEASLNVSNPWEIIINNDPAPQRKWRWWIHALVDIGGAVIGYLDEGDPRQAQASGTFASAIYAGSR